MKLTDAELARIKHRQIAPDAVRSVFGSCSHRRSPWYWKGGGIIGVARFADGTEQRLAISLYGGFFQVISSGRFYQIGKSSIHEYAEMIDGEYSDADEGSDVSQ